MKRHLKIATLILLAACTFSTQLNAARIVIPVPSEDPLPRRLLKPLKHFDGAGKKSFKPVLPLRVTSTKKRLGLGFWNSRAAGFLGMAAVAGATALMAGCDDEDKHKCGDTRWFHNNTSLETLELRFANRSVWLAQGLSTNQCIEGTRYLDVYEKYSGELITTIDLWSNGGGPVYLTDPLEAKLRVDNRTNGVIEVLVNGRLFDRVNPGVFWDFPVRAGARHITIRKVDAPWLIYCDCHENVQPGDLIERIITD